MDRQDLVKVYNTVLRPAVEYSSVVYHSLIPQHISDKLETIQKQAYKIMFGHGINYGEIVENGTVELLSDRREEAILRFATRAAATSRFGDKWFRRREETEREVRTSTRRPYKEKFCRTNRMKNNPIQYMTRKLNEKYLEAS